MQWTRFGFGIRTLDERENDDFTSLDLVLFVAERVTADCRKLGNERKQNAPADASPSNQMKFSKAEFGQISDCRRGDKRTIRRHLFLHTKTVTDRIDCLCSRYSAMASLTSRNRVSRPVHAKKGRYRHSFALWLMITQSSRARRPSSLGG